jgi:aspartate/methionine/tyrosine aminotransferase
MPKLPARLRDIPSIGVERMGATADALRDPAVLRLENLDTDLRPYAPALEAAHRAIDADPANSYLPFLGAESLRRAAAVHVSRMSGIDYHWNDSCVVTAGGMNGILNTLFALIDPGDKVVLHDPIYAGIVNRIRLAGGSPAFAPLVPTDGGWRVDLDAFRQAAGAPGVRAAILMSPAMPTGAVFTEEEWRALAEICVERDLWLIYDAAMERILFDGRTPFHPASLPGMADRTITIGSASKELRMIGWRVGWVVGPPEVIRQVATVGIANTVCLVGIAMDSVAVALEAPSGDVAAAVAEWQRRRDIVLEELAGTAHAIPPHGGWSLLIDVAELGLAAADASARLLSEAQIAATPMINWGSERAARYVRLVYSNEPCDRLRGIGARVRRVIQYLR